MPIVSNSSPPLAAPSAETEGVRTEAVAVTTVAETLASLPAATVGARLVAVAVTVVAEMATEEEIDGEATETLAVTTPAESDDPAETVGAMMMTGRVSVSGAGG